MDTDIRRIGIGNIKFPGIDQEVILVPEVLFTADSEIIYADTTNRKVDEDF